MKVGSFEKAVNSWSVEKAVKLGHVKMAEKGKVGCIDRAVKV